MIEDVFKIRNRICVFEVVFFCGFKDCSVCMVFKFKGVVALFKLSILVVRFKVIVFWVGWFFGIFGMMWVKKGDNKWLMLLIRLVCLVILKKLD